MPWTIKRIVACHKRLVDGDSKALRSGDVWIGLGERKWAVTLPPPANAVPESLDRWSIAIQIFLDAFVAASATDPAVSPLNGRAETD
jgi:hypothetical protein